jgi:hypothetical protein
MTQICIDLLTSKCNCVTSRFDIQTLLTELACDTIKFMTIFYCPQYFDTLTPNTWAKNM